MIIEALGIEVGDKVWQMFGTYQGTPYRVESIHGPYFWTPGNIAVIVWPYPVISLYLKSWNYPKDGQTYGINDIHKDGNRWFTDQGDEVFVEKPKNRKALQIDLFSLSNSKNIYSYPYQFLPEIDYSDPNKVFKCKKCSLDFNGAMNSWTTPYCPVCEKSAGVSDKIIVMERVEPGKKYFSSYQRALGAFGYPTGVIMRTCKNCVFRKLRTLDCALYGTCVYQVPDPENEHCEDHQYSEKVIKPVLDEAVGLLDSFMITLSNTYEKRAKKVIDKRDEIFQDAK